MQLYVGKNGQQLGPFSLEEVNRKLADRTFLGTDLAWYEGAAGWAPLSSVAGVVLPPAESTAPAVPVAGAAPMPAPTPAPVPAAVPSRPSAYPAQPVATGSRSYKTMARVGWILLGATLLISCIPILGCGAWILVWPVAIAAIILGIITISRGGTGSGIGLIIAAIVLLPVAYIVPVFTTALLGDKQERQNETQIMENLRSIDGAKSQWVTATKATNGADVTMANLTTYLSGKEIKPVVEENYDPAPVGQPPTATLPAKKSLGGFTQGEVLTAAAIEQDLAKGSFSWIKTSITKLGNAPSPTPAVIPSMPPKVTTPPASPSPSAAPKPAVSPPPSSSPSPSASPRSSTAPHSLISPRQQQEPEESPSARQSPSAKFAPQQKGPPAKPRQSPSEPDNSGGLRQGKKNPPGEVPSPSPEEDDE
ncbi:MAG TPA: DUF4339 domain-containing protein [Chthoniobacterales bacterium]|nr:DUF4339 domain-containing protein [Chthoniobacterales bacterium]